jgi:hypothetical protein
LGDDQPASRPGREKPGGENPGSDDPGGQNPGGLKAFSQSLSRAGRRSRSRTSTKVVLLLIPVLAVVAIVGGSTDIGPAVKAARGIGTHGYFVARTETCHRGSCNWTGDFRTAGGAVTRTGIKFDGGQSGMRAGSAVPALDSGGHSAVFPPTGSHEWIADLAALLGGTAVLAAWIWIVPARAIRRRRAGHRMPGGAAS